jgi:hypothetical protein
LRIAAVVGLELDKCCDHFIYSNHNYRQSVGGCPAGHPYYTTGVEEIAYCVASCLVLGKQVSQL